MEAFKSWWAMRKRKKLKTHTLLPIEYQYLIIN